MTQSCEMDLLVRYFDEAESKVKVRSYDAQLFGHVTSLDLQKHFNDVVKELYPNKLLQIGMDDPIVNLTGPKRK